MKTTWKIVLLAMLLGCTERVPIAPQYTEDTSWTPTINLIGSGYQRFGIDIDDPPDKQITRNIHQYVVEYRPPGADAFTPLDTASSVRFLPSGYDTPAPILQEGEEYSVRMVAEYRNGVRRESNVLTFVCPVTRGKVLRRIAMPVEAQNLSLLGMGFHNRNLLALFENRLFRVDTSSGNVVLLKTIDLFYSFPQIAIHGDTLVLVDQGWFFGPILYSFFDLNALDFVGNGFAVELEENAQLDKIAYDGRHIFLTTLTFEPLMQQLHKIDAVTGETISTSSKFEPVLNKFVIADNRLWSVVYASTYDLRMQSFDPQTLDLQRDFQHPVYHGTDLAWDGAHFWTWDFDTRSFVKIALEEFRR